MKLMQRHLLLMSFLLIMVSCRKPFSPAVTTANVNYLVVEGVINSGPDSTNIKLSRTTPLAGGNKIVIETNALVTVLSDAGDKYTLSESTPGIYTFYGLNLPVTKKYCLHITTSNGEEYQSDFEENKITPDIDSVAYTPQKSGVQFYVNTHDNTNSTRYYRWDYDETWTYFSIYNSVLYYKNQQIIARPIDSLVYECYEHAIPSNSIFVGTSNNLVQDVINHFPLGYVDASTGKISHVYSLLVKQYALTPDAFSYWQLLQKNTEQLGSIFDVQPSSTGGNIYCISHPAEPVIGFISVSTIKTKRIFVSGNTLPFHVPNQVPPPNPNECGSDSILFVPTFTYNVRLSDIFATGDTIPISFLANPATNMVIGYTYAPIFCVDCRVLGGTNVKPSYWPF
jgi:hypothetical protein